MRVAPQCSAQDSTGLGTGQHTGQAAGQGGAWRRTSLRKLLGLVSIRRLAISSSSMNVALASAGGGAKAHIRAEVDRMRCGAQGGLAEAQLPTLKRKNIWQSRRPPQAVEAGQGDL